MNVRVSVVPRWLLEVGQPSPIAGVGRALLVDLVCQAICGTELLLAGHRPKVDNRTAGISFHPADASSSSRVSGTSIT
jgi:hypothetical protein